ncbi:MAG TPA: hypothetical protein VGV64_00910 [Thermoplasmata archaeon]|nr:hypothetical protein [Thermoplasmata archaeon]HEV2428395.1 hypothetical protein [Thermoplasmata archaeon]
MRVSIRIPAHLPPLRPAGPPSDEDDPKFVNRPCYVFNPSLRPEKDDAHCRHCRHYLTSACPHIDEFLDDVEDLSPE